MIDRHTEHSRRVTPSSAKEIRATKCTWSSRVVWHARSPHRIGRSCPSWSLPKRTATSLASWVSWTKMMKTASRAIPIRRKFGGSYHWGPRVASLLRRLTACVLIWSWVKSCISRKWHKERQPNIKSRRWGSIMISQLKEAVCSRRSKYCKRCRFLKMLIRNIWCELQPISFLKLSNTVSSLSSKDRFPRDSIWSLKASAEYYSPGAHFGLFLIWMIHLEAVSQAQSIRKGKTSFETLWFRNSTRSHQHSTKSIALSLFTRTRECIPKIILR